MMDLVIILISPSHGFAMVLSSYRVKISLVSEREEIHIMKKHIAALTAIAVLSVGAAGQASASTVHTVEKGDTLWDISKEMNVSVQDLQEWNGLNSTIIYPSQKLKVVETHTVVLGDTLSHIAQKHGLSVDELMEQNQLTSDLIFPGDKLVLEGTKAMQVKGSSVSQPSTSTPKTTTNTTANAIAKKTTNATTNTTANTTAKATTKATTNTTAKASTKASTNTSSPTASTVKEISVASTAYTASCDGCSGITSTGIDLNANPNQKVISVDPTVIPLGSRVWVEGYGEAIAGDTGGSIKGNKIDIYMQSKEDAINWGRKTVKVKILD